MDYKLFKKYQLGNTLMKNRMVMSPLTRSRAIANVPNDLMATYYGQRAGAGLIITEGTSPSKNGVGYPRIPGIYEQQQIDGWKKVTEEVHRKGGKIFLQLMHCGRVAHPENIPAGGKVMAPSAVKLEQTKMYVDGKGELDIPVAKAMDKKDIEAAIKEYRQAAGNAMKAGFDGVEIHGANGYLIDQFINPASNQRDDEYGGSIENRIRFALEVAQEVIAEIGSGNTGIRISPYGAMNEMTSAYESVEETFEYLATQLNRLGLAYIHIADHSSMGAPEVPGKLKQQIRTIFNNSLILAGGYDKESAESDLQADKADLIAFGRPFIANPDLVSRFVENAALNQPNFDTFYTPGADGYTDYPIMTTESVK
jgi:N-ethylmaleimide reductase